MPARPTSSGSVPALLLPSSAGCRGRPWADHRRIVEAIAYRYRTGIPWRDLPISSVWGRHTKPRSRRGATR
ncbi:hypothetical protein B0T36_19895 [Nocardia donostiensis]|nr:hypothetical protein B0T36_19895 [Nocardia donostiensis]